MLLLKGEESHFSEVVLWREQCAQFVDVSVLQNPSTTCSIKFSFIVSSCGFIHQSLSLVKIISSKNTLISSGSSSRILLHNLIHGSLPTITATIPRIQTLYLHKQHIYFWACRIFLSVIFYSCILWLFSLLIHLREIFTFKKLDWISV